MLIHSLLDSFHGYGQGKFISPRNCSARMVLAVFVVSSINHVTLLYCKHSSILSSLMLLTFFSGLDLFLLYRYCMCIARRQCRCRDPRDGPAALAGALSAFGHQSHCQYRCSDARCLFQIRQGALRSCLERACGSRRPPPQTRSDDKVRNGRATTGTN